ncbi:MAG: hypothetical protein Q9200_006179 [Gallowayella weberi]
MDWFEAVQQPSELQAIGGIDPLLLPREFEEQLDIIYFADNEDSFEAVPSEDSGELLPSDMDWFEPVRPSELQAKGDIDPPAISREDEEELDKIDFANMDWYEALTPVESTELQPISEVDQAISRKTDEELKKIRWGTMFNLPYYYWFAKEGGGDRFVKQLAPDCQWNYNGRISWSAEAAMAAVLENAKGCLRDLHQRGVYILLDGTVGALLYHLHEDKAGPFAGHPSPDGMWRHVLGAARVVFNAAALAEDVLTLEPMYLLRGEQCGTDRIGSSLPPSVNHQTSPEFRALMREEFKQLLSNVNDGFPEINARLATEKVQVNENGSVAVGLEAFVKLVAGHNAGKGAFPEKRFQTIHILAEGRLGFVEYIWESVQKGDYVGMSSSGAIVRQRGMLFLLVDERGLVAAATGVYDERELPLQIQHGLFSYV